MRKIYIHIGAPKTGTSALQVFFKRNRRKLLENGLLYCNTGMTDDSGQAKLAWNLMNINFGEVIDDKIWIELEKEIKLYHGNILLSSEYFWILSDNAIEKFRNMFSDFQFKIVIYLRRQDEWAMANALQEIKIYNKKWDSINKLINSILDNAYYYPIIKKWSAIFSDNNIIIRPYEKEQFYEDNIFSDFMLNCLGLKLTDDYILPEKDINPRLSRDAVEYKLLVNNLPIKKNEKNSILEALFLYSKDIDPKTQNPFQEHMLLSPNERNKIIDRFKHDNKRIAKEFLGRKDGKLFYADLPKNDMIWEQYNGLEFNATIEISKYILSNKYPIATENLIKDILNKAIIKGVMSEILNESMLINLSQSYSEKIKYIFNNAETVYICPLEELERIPSHNDISNFIYKKDGLHINVVGLDPIMVMPYFTKMVKNQKYLLIKITITVPLATELELFYGTMDSNGNNIPFNAKEKIKYPVKKGKHEIYMEINSDKLINRLRLDPGNIPGEYILHSFEVRV